MKHFAQAIDVILDIQETLTSKPTCHVHVEAVLLFDRMKCNRSLFVSRRADIPTLYGYAETLLLPLHLTQYASYLEGINTIGLKNIKYKS